MPKYSLEALLDPVALLPVKRSKHSNRAVSRCAKQLN